QRLEIVLRCKHEIVDAIVLRSLSRAPVLLAPGSDSLAVRRHGFLEHHARHGQPEVDHLAMSWRQLNPEVEPLLLVWIPRSLHLGLQRAAVPARGVDQPVRLVPLGHGRDDLGLAEGDYAPPDRIPDERQVAEPPCQPLHLGRRAGVEAQLLPGVVADVAVPEVHRPPAEVEGSEPLADGHLQGPTSAGHADEQSMEPMRPLPGDHRIPNPRQPPPETRDGGLELVELDLRFAAALAHDSSVATPSDIPPRWSYPPRSPRGSQAKASSIVPRGRYSNPTLPPYPSSSRSARNSRIGCFPVPGWFRPGTSAICTCATRAPQLPSAPP